MAIEELEAKSIPELVEKTLLVRSNVNENHMIWYRGINNHNHDLRPKIMREGKESEEVFEREKRLITRFRQRSMAYWPEGYPQNDWEHLFAMQHYGLSTRLLDWSENLFVSAHFALKHADAETKPIIWCMDPIKWNRSMPGLSEFGDSIQVMTTADEYMESYRPDSSKRRSKSPVAMYGAHNSGRIVAQRGTFSVWGSDIRSMEDFAEEQKDTILWKIVLHGDRERMRRDVHDLGFSETMIFPELSSLAIELELSEGWRA